MKRSFMKHLSLVVLLVATSLFAATDAQITAYLKDQVYDNISVAITDRQAITEHEGYEVVTATLSDGTQSQTMNLFVKDGLLFPDIIDLSTGNSMKQILEQVQVQKKLSKIYKEEDDNNIISIGDDKNKKTMVVFTDPECPYCRNELGNVEDRLKEFNIKFILTSVHDEPALKKSHLIYKETAKAKTDKAKIEILRKYFDEDVEIDQEVSEEDVSSMHKLRRKYLQGGLKGVPFMIDEAILLH